MKQVIWDMVLILFVIISCSFVIWLWWDNEGFNKEMEGCIVEVVAYENLNNNFSIGVYKVDKGYNKVMLHYSQLEFSWDKLNVTSLWGEIGSKQDAISGKVGK